MIGPGLHGMHCMDWSSRVMMFKCHTYDAWALSVLPTLFRRRCRTTDLS